MFSLLHFQEENDTDDIIILEPACTAVPSKKSQPIPKIKFRKLTTGEDVWDFGKTSTPSVVIPLPSSPTITAKSEFSFSTLKEEQGEYVEFKVPSSPTAVAKTKLSFPSFKKEQEEYVEVKVPPPPEITLSYQDCGSKSHPCVNNKLNNRRPWSNCEDFEVIEVLPSRSNKRESESYEGFSR